MFRILSIDGGGVRGIVSALVLAELEERSGRPVAELVDLVAGTSTGAILALGLVCPGSDGRPAWSARELADAYLADSPAIFRRSPVRSLRTVNGFLAPRYDPEPLERMLGERLGAARLSQALCDVIVPAYDLRRREPYFFKRLLDLPVDDQPMRLVARASASPPTYFPPVSLHSSEGDRWLVDGGVCANNPGLCAVADVRRYRPEADVVLVSVGSGQLSRDLSTRRLRRAGALLWARPLFDVMLDGQEDVTHYELRQLLPADRYHRFQADLDPRAEGIDDASPGNLAALREHAARLIEARSADLDAVAALLAGPREGAA